MKCPNCGNELKENAVFCGKCGNRVLRSNAAAVPLQPSSEAGIHTMPAGSGRVPGTGAAVQKNCTVYRVIAAICFLLLAIFIFVPTIEDPSVLKKGINSISEAVGSSRRIATSFSFVSIFKEVGDGQFSGVAVFFGIVHLLFCIGSAAIVLLAKPGKWIIPGITSLFSLLYIALVGMFKLLLASKIVFPYTGAVVLIILAAALSLTMTDLIKAENGIKVGTNNKRNVWRKNK